jgi:hypothetical protein
VGERRSNRNAVEKVAERIKAHNDQKGGAMTSAVAAEREAAEIARKADASKADRTNPNRNRSKRESEARQEESRPRRRSSGPRIFIDLGKKG